MPLYYIVTKKGIFAASRIKKNFIKNYTMLFSNTLNFTKSLTITAGLYISSNL